MLSLAPNANEGRQQSFCIFAQMPKSDARHTGVPRSNGRHCCTTMTMTKSRPESRGLTRTLAAFAAELPASDIPRAAHDLARRALVDTVGVMLAGRIEQPVGLLCTTLADGGEAVSLAAGRSLRARDAALADGFAAHVLDYDDVARHGHPSVVVVPAVLAKAQQRGASGVEVLDACAIGEEVWAELARREAGTYHSGSWHPTSTLGILAATAALCRLEKVGVDTAMHALGLSASFSSGIIASFGSDAKPLQAGRAAAAAIEAVNLAGAGLSGSHGALEGAHGLLRGISPKGNVDCEPMVLASEGVWQSLADGLSIKRYPVCYASHRAIDAVLDLGEHDLKPDDVASITASIGPSPAETVDNPVPRTGLEARFSLQHNLAAALLDRAVGFVQLEDAYVRRDDVARLYDLTGIETVAGDCPDQPGMAKCDRVQIVTRDGRRLDSGPVRYPRGHARAPLDDAGLDAKFRDCASRGGVEAPQRILDSLRSLEQVADMRAEMERW